MSRRSDRLGIAPESLSNPQTLRWMHARNLQNAAAWRRSIMREDRRGREIARSWFLYELGLGTAKRVAYSGWPEIP